MVDQALKRLNERSLLGFSLDGQAVSTHGLVARAARRWLARRGRLATACRAAASTLEASAAALVQPQDQSAAREMLGQITALLENADASTDDADDKLARMLIRLRFLALCHLIELGDDMPRAIEIGEPLTADLERLLGDSHPDTLSARDGLAAAYKDVGRVAEAITLFEQTLAERERLLGPDDPDTMRSRNDLARAYREGGRVADAVPLVERLSRPGNAYPVTAIPAPSRRGTISPPPTGLPAGPPRPSPCSRRTWPHASGCSVPITPRPWLRGTTSTSPARSRRRPRTKAAD